MEKRRLGRSPLVVSEICLGTMTFGSMADEAASLRMLDKSFDAGIDFLDTAEAYPVPPDANWAGRTEEIVGKWLSGRPRDSVIVATKIAGPSGGWFQAPVRHGKGTLDRHSITVAIESSLKRLRTDYIDLYQTHWPDPGLPYEETLEGLSRAIDAGKIRVAGCSNETAYGLTKSLWTAAERGLPRYETIQNNFSLLNRRFEDALAEVCRREQVSLIPYSPIAGGVLSGKYLDDAWPDGARFTLYRQVAGRGEAMTRRFVNEKSLESTRRLAGIAARAGMPIVTLAVAWSLAHDFVASTIIGATRPEQLDDILLAAGKKLSKDVLSACDRVTRDLLYPMG